MCSCEHSWHLHKNPNFVRIRESKEGREGRERKRLLKELENSRKLGVCAILEILVYSLHYVGWHYIGSGHFYYYQESLSLFSPPRDEIELLFSELKTSFDGSILH